MSSGPGPTSSPRERRELIRRRAAADGFVRIDQLAEEFGVSAMTVHRDLDDLQAHGWLRKVRGGATAAPSLMFHGDVAHRASQLTSVKERLAARAAELISPGQTVMVDESTTCLHLAPHLLKRTPLTVITHFLPLIRQLAGQPDLDLVILGGSYYPAYEAALGQHTAEAVQSFRADLLFLSTTAVAKDRCYHQSQETVQVNRALMDAAARKVLLVDHTKFSRQGLYLLAPLTSFDLIYVDNELPAEQVRHIRDLGVQVRLV